MNGCDGISLLDFKSAQDAERLAKWQKLERETWRSGEKRVLKRQDKKNQVAVKKLFRSLTAKLRSQVMYCGRR